MDEIRFDVVEDIFYTQQLKSCPFCGHKALLRMFKSSRKDSNGDYICLWEIECPYCDINMSSQESFDDCLNIWNHRDVGLALQEVAKTIATGFNAD